MKKTSIILLLLLLISSFGFTQETQKDYNERMNLIQAEELKIKKFITENINYPIPASIQQKIEEGLDFIDDHGDHAPEISNIDRDQRLLLAKQYYWRLQYFQQHPDTQKKVYSSTRLAAGSCDNGDFELGNFTNYTGESAWASGNGYRYGDCAILTLDPLYLISPIVFSPDPLTAPEHFFITTSPGTDPNVGINVVNSGNHAARINSWLDEPGYSNPQFGVNKLIKQVVLSSSNEDIFFNYAVVLEDPGTTHDDQKPTFVARIMDADGNECDRLCNSAYSSDPFLDSNATGTIRFKDWECAVLSACGNIGDTVTLEFIATDCGQGAHWGYAYIDDICDTCVLIEDTCNYHGDVELDPIDTCSTLPLDVCGSFNFAVINCAVATVNDIRLTILQGGVPVTVGIPTYTLSGTDFCFTLDSSFFPLGTMPGEGFDFYVEIDFLVWDGSIHTENDYHANPGTDNDYIFGADCCPEFDLLTCCDLIGGKTMIDPAIQYIMDTYRNNMAVKYQHKDGGSDPCCDPCNYPTDSFPVFVTDTAGFMIDAGTYDITWSHDPGNMNAFAYLLPNQQTIVTVFNPADSCYWTDTMYVQCCEDTIEIQSLCTWDPCLYPKTPMPLNIIDQDGNILSPPAYLFLWSNGYTGNSTSVLPTDLPIWVTVTDTATRCVYTDTFTLNCCEVEVPENLKCDNNVFFWDSVFGAIGYEIEVIFNDPNCCHTQDFPSAMRYTTTDTLYDLSWVTGCFSVKVRAICGNNEYSPWSQIVCNCVVSSCESISPPNLSCSSNVFTWSAVMGAVGYEVEITYDDPACCSQGFPSANRYTTTGTIYDFSGVNGCFSVKVRAICSHTTYSPWSSTICYCPDIHKSGEFQPGIQGTGIIINEVHTTIVPNPAEDQVTITLHDHKHVLIKDQVTLAIYDINNREVYRAQVSINTAKKIDIGAYASGIYICKMITDNTIISSKELIIK